MAVLPRFLLVFALQYLLVHGEDVLVATVPNLVRVGDTETVLVTIQKANADNPREIPVTVSFKNADNTIIVEENIIIREAVGLVNSEIVSLYVNPENIPSIEHDEEVSRYITATVTCETLGFSQSKQVLLSLEGGFFFIQTDKPIYTPKQTVRIRLISLNQRLSPLQQQIQLDIRTPQDIAIKRRVIKAGSVINGVYVHNFQFPDEPMAGNWSIVAYYGKDMKSNRTVQFEMKEYVLPTFSVEIHPPEFLLKTNVTIRVEVNAKYVYNKPVQGRSILKIGVIDPDGEIEFKDTDIQTLVGGQAAHEPDIDILGENWFENYIGCSLHLETTVWEEATGHFENASDTTTKIVNSPYVFNRERTVHYFKKGLPFQVKTELKFANGNPATRVPVRVVAKGRIPNEELPIDLRQQLDNDDENGENEDITDATDNSGQVNFNLYVPNGCTEITVELTTLDETLIVEGQERLDSNANLAFVLHPYESPGDANYLVIRVPDQRMREGDLFTLDLFLKRSEVNADTFIQVYVISRGRIVDFGSKRVGDVDGYDIRVTHDMIPSCRIVAFFITQQGHVIADSAMIEIQRECQNSLHVRIVNDEKRRINEARPNGQIQLQMSGQPGTTVSLLAVDKAVLLLRDFHRLTSDKMYSTMDTHDTGCGPGGGRNSEHVFKNAGVTVMTSRGPLDVDQREGIFCISDAVNRRRRSLDDLLAVHGDNNRTSFACTRGHRVSTLGSGTCTDKSQRFRTLAQRKYRDIIDENELNELIVIFIACCERDDSRERSNGFDFSDFGNIVAGDLENVDLRKDFPESWAFHDVHLDSFTPVYIPYTLPGSITSWSIHAFGLHEDFAMCVIEPKELLVSSDLFIQLRMPYSVMRNEHVEIQATVFNYGDDDLAIRMFMKTPNEVCSEGTPNTLSAEKEFTVAARDAYTITYVVIGVEIGEWPITVVIVSTKGSDGIEKKLNVVAEGIERTFHHSVPLNPQGVQINRRRRDIQITEECIWDEENQAQISCLDIGLPPTVVPGTESCHISISGNPLGPAITAVVSGLGRWIRRPTGCGEQTMIYLAPNVYVLKYLRDTESGNEDVDRTAVSNVESGVAREITYRHADGSFSAFLSRPGSTWLTAFVAKVFCQASELTAVDLNVACGAMRWITDNRQRDNGAFYEGNYVVHREMTGGIAGDIGMTAFTLIAIAECSCDQQIPSLPAATSRATTYLESQLDGIQQPYMISVVTYALALVGSGRRFDANTKLKSHATEDRATGSRAWGADIQPENEQPFWYKRRPSALSVETTGYALLAQIALREVSYARGIANWLSTQQNYGGGFVSTQDTVIALQSLSEFSALNIGGDLDLQCNITATNGFKEILQLENEDLLLQKITKIPKESIRENLFVTTQGQGLGTLNVEVKYNEVITDESELCPFDLQITSERANREQPDDEQIRYEVGDQLSFTIEVSYLGDTNTSMGIIDFGLFTGFVPDEDSCKRVLKRNPLVSRYELSDRSVIFYTDYIPIQRESTLRIEFEAVCEFNVTNIHHAAVKVYDYYHPDQECTKFYAGEGSNVVKTLCNDDQCTCVSSECPSCDREINSRVLLDAACASAHTYAFQITVIDINVKDGYTVINATINHPIKRGDEQDIEDDDNREFWVSSACPCPKIRYRQYLIIGSNALKYTIPQGDGATDGFRYVIDNNTIVKRWKRKLFTEVQRPIENGQSRCR